MDEEPRYFLTRCNTDRRHQALGMKVSAELYARSARVYRGLDELTNPFHDQTFMGTGCGRICFRGRRVNSSHVFAGQREDVTQINEPRVARYLHATLWVTSTRNVSARTD
jgi:putative transposase